jgi:signal transduction histidine kinase
MTGRESDEMGEGGSGLRHVVSVGLILGIGVVLSTIHLAGIFGSTENIWTVVTGGVTSLVFTLAVIGIGVWAGRTWGPESTTRLALWCAGGTASFFALAFLARALVESQGGTLPLGPRWFAGASSTGALLGSILGVYDVRHVRTRRRWRTAKGRTERLNDRLRRSNERLMVMNRVLRHNVRNDLNVVQGRADLIADRNTGVDARDAETIADVAENLVTQSDKARTLESLMGADGDRRTVDLRTVLERELASLGQSYPDVGLAVEIPEQVFVEAAPSLDTAVGNLLENAAKHNDADAPRVTVTVERNATETELVVADNGPGVPEHELDVLTSGSETKLEHTSGLGLWTTVWVVEHSDGEIEFADNDPRGTVVRVRLPSAEGVDGFDHVGVTASVPT